MVYLCCVVSPFKVLIFCPWPLKDRHAGLQDFLQIEEVLGQSSGLGLLLV